MAGGDGSQQKSSSRQRDNIIDTPNTTNTTSSQLQVEFDPLFSYISRKYTHTSELFHAINVLHHIKRRKRNPDSTNNNQISSCSSPCPEDSSIQALARVPPASTSKPFFSIINLNSLKVSANVVLPEECNTTMVAGHIIGVDGDNYASKDSLYLMVIYTIKDDTDDYNPLPSSRFFAVLCPKSHLPTSLVDEMKSQNNKWTKDWKKCRDWSNSPNKAFKTEPTKEGNNDVLKISEGPKPLLGKIVDPQLAKSLCGGLIFYQTRGRRQEYKMITKKPFLFSTPKSLANIFVVTESESSFVITGSKSRHKHVQLVRNIASTKKYSLCENTINSQKLYDTLREVIGHAEDQEVTSDDRCLQYALCGNSTVNNRFGCIHHR